MDNPGTLITSAANPTVKMLKSLSVKKYREEEGLFLVEGRRHIEDAVAGSLRLAILTHDAEETIPAPLRAAAGQVMATTRDMLRRITGRDNAQGMAAAFTIPHTALADARNGLWIGLESVRDPGNLGTIIRTADAAGADGVMLIGDCCDPYAPETIRASMGSFARIKVVKATTAEFMSWRASWPGRVTGTHLHRDAVDYRAAAYSLPLLLLMGGESAGLSDDSAAMCDTLIKIPMAGGAESLNLAVSTGIMLYEILRERL